MRMTKAKKLRRCDIQLAGIYLFLQLFHKLKISVHLVSFDLSYCLQGQGPGCEFSNFFILML